VNGGSLDDELLQYHMNMNSKNPHPKNAKEVFVDAMVESALLSCEKAQSF
jgi:4-hydroxy-3-methylbut-2-en-1-yl diphosphate synthase IspG/GcpE